MRTLHIREKSSLASIFLTFGVDQLGATIVFPIFAPLFLSPAQQLFPPEASSTYQAAMLGVFLGIFPFMQFLFAPMLGEYADHHGRRKTLIFTIFLTCFGYALCGSGIHYRSLFFIFFGRLIMGIGAGNLSICLSALADLSLGPKRKVRYFGYGSAVAGMMFIFGPFIGGKLSDPSVNAWFDSSFPLFIGAGLSLMNGLLVVLFFRETLQRCSTQRFDLIKGIRNIRIALMTKSVRNFYLIYFFYLFSWNIIFLFIPAFAVQNFFAHKLKNWGSLRITWTRLGLWHGGHSPHLGHVPLSEVGAYCFFFSLFCAHYFRLSSKKSLDVYFPARHLHGDFGMGLASVYGSYFQCSASSHSRKGDGN